MNNYSILTSVGGGGGSPSVGPNTSGGGGGYPRLHCPKYEPGGEGPCVGPNTRPNDVYVTMWGISGLINYNLAVNLLCVSLNTFRRERNFKMREGWQIF